MGSFAQTNTQYEKINKKLGTKYSSPAADVPRNGEIKQYLYRLNETMFCCKFCFSPPLRLDALMATNSLTL